MYGCTGVQVPPPFHTFYSHALGCVGMRCHSPYYWKLLEPPGTPRILLDVPHPQYLKCMAALVCTSPPLHTFFPMLWAVLACVAILPTTGNYWNHLELLGFSWMCPTPSTWNVWLHWCAGPPPFHTFYSHALGCAGMRCHSPYYWKLLEPPGTPRILLDVPHPQYRNVWLHWCAGPPPFHTFYSHALGCVGMRCHSPYYWKLLEPPGTPRILLDVPHPQYLKCMAALVCRSPPLSYILFPCSGLCWHALPFSLLLETIGTTDPRILLDVPCPPVPEMYSCTDVQVPPLQTWQTENPQLVLGSW